MIAILEPAWLVEIVAYAKACTRNAVRWKRLSRGDFDDVVDAIVTKVLEELRAAWAERNRRVFTFSSDEVEELGHAVLLDAMRHGTDKAMAEAVAARKKWKLLGEFHPDYHPDPRFHDPAAEFAVRTGMTAVLRSLNKVQQLILQGTCDGMSVRQIGGVLGLSKDKIFRTQKTIFSRIERHVRYGDFSECSKLLLEFAC